MRKTVPYVLFAVSLCALFAACAAAGADVWLIGCAVRAAGVWLFGLWCAGFFPRELRLAAAAVCSVGALALVTLAASATGVHGLVWWLFLLGSSSGAAAPQSGESASCRRGSVPCAARSSCSRAA